jgi:hypothetical protein
MSLFKRITFQAACAYAAGKMERFRDDQISIFLQLDSLGIKVLLRSPRVNAAKVVSWHDIEHKQYDALREGIDEVCREFEGFNRTKPV